MGNSSSSPPTASRRSSPSRNVKSQPRIEVESPSKSRRSRYAPVEVEAPARRQSRAQVESPSKNRRWKHAGVEVEAPTKERRVASPSRGRGKRQSALPRDPTTGRYLPRGQRMASPARQRVASPRRRVEVDVVAAPRVTKPRRPQVEIESEDFQEPRVTFVERPNLEPTARGGPILRSSYTRMADGAEEEAEAPVQRRVVASRARSASPARRQATAAPTRLPVSRREYASPSLAATSLVDENQVPIGPSTVRRMRKMATDPDVAAEAPQPERMAQTAAPQSNLEQILFSYMNTP